MTVNNNARCFLSVLWQIRTSPLRRLRAFPVTSGSPQNRPQLNRSNPPGAIHRGQQI